MIESYADAFGDVVVFCGSGLLDWNVVAIKRDRSITELTDNVYVTKDRVELFEKSGGTRVWYTSFEKGTKPYEILKTWDN